MILKGEPIEPWSLIREVVGGPSHMVMDCGGCCRGIARSNGVNDGLVARDVHIPDGALEPGEHDRHPSPGGASGEQAFLLELSHGFGERG